MVGQLAGLEGGGFISRRAELAANHLRQADATDRAGIDDARTADLDGCLLYTSFAEAQRKAERIQCVNNLKQIGLAGRLWAGDNKDVYPSNFICMTNELSTWKILQCPSDKSHNVTNWAEVAAGNISYIMDAAGIHGLYATPKGVRHGFGINATASEIPLNKMCIRDRSGTPHW